MVSVTLVDGRIGSLCSVFGVVLAVLASGCRKAEPQKGAPALPASAVSAASSTPVLPAPAPSTHPAEDAAAAVVLAWNNALDRHDVAVLGTLYADPLRFYGRTLTKTAVVSAKAAAFRKQPTFRQQIVGPVSSSRADDGTLIATFTKRSGEDGKLSETSAKLVLQAGDGGTWLVVEEADASTAPAEVVGGCQEVVADVVNALPAVKRAVAEAQAAADKSGGRATFGGVGPIDDDDGGFSASIGIHTDERFEAMVSYSVDGKGRLSVTAGGDEIKLSAAAMRSVQRACHP